jgi:hypothetical protein
MDEKVIENDKFVAFIYKDVNRKANTDMNDAVPQSSLEWVKIHQLSIISIE